MSKAEVKAVLEYAIKKGYQHTGMLTDEEVDNILNSINPINMEKNLTREALEQELWNMLPDDCRAILQPLKKTYIESLMADIDSYCEGHKPPGPVWVKASTRLPLPGFYNAKKNGQPFIMAMTENDKKMPKEYWEGVEWLDESGTPAPERDESDAVEFANWILKHKYYPIEHRERMWSGASIGSELSTSAQLYQLFKQSPAERSGGTK